MVDDGRGGGGGDDGAGGGSGAGLAHVDPAGREVEGAAQAAGGDDPPSFTVRDRRFWARDAGDDEDGPSRAERPAVVRELEARATAAEERAAATLQQYQAARGDFEAARARLAREQGREVEAAKRVFMADILEVLDNLGRALGAAQKGGDDRGEGLLAGVEMVQRQFLAKLAGLGVRPMNAAGAAFDAARHEALSTVPVAGAADDGRVLGVIREGYLLGDSVLRTAQVAVGRAAPPPGAGAPGQDGSAA